MISLIFSNTLFWLSRISITDSFSDKSLDEAHFLRLVLVLTRKESMNIAAFLIFYLSFIISVHILRRFNNIA